MATLQQLQEQLKHGMQRRAILTHVIEHLEGSFLTKFGAVPDKVLLATDKLPVMEAEIDAFIGELVGAVDKIDADVAALLGVEYQPVPPSTQQQTQTPPQTEVSK